MKQTSGLEPIEDIEGLRFIRKANLRCTVVHLPQGGAVLYSPIAKTSGVASMAAPIRFLLAPNHYHNMGLKEHEAAFPEATFVCSAAARPRLEKVTGIGFSGLENLAAVLPEHASLVEPQGLKTGEVWLCLRTGKEVIWIVTDAFCGVGAKGNAGAELGFLKPFPTYGLRDKSIFSKWVRGHLDLEAPTVIVPCHGDVIRGDNLKRDIGNLLDTL